MYAGFCTSRIERQYYGRRDGTFQGKMHNKGLTSTKEQVKVIEKLLSSIEDTAELNPSAIYQQSLRYSHSVDNVLLFNNVRYM